MKIVIKAHPTIGELLESKKILEEVLVDKKVYTKSETEKVINAFLNLDIVEILETGTHHPHFKICNLNEVCRMCEINRTFKLVARYTQEDGELYKTIARK